MKCYFCNEEIHKKNLQYPRLDICFNCGRPICSDCSGGTEEIVGDVRVVYCRYCKNIRDNSFFPINVNKIYSWLKNLNKVYIDTQSEILKVTIEDMKRCIPENFDF